MFEFIIGDIVNIKDDYLILQNNGIGYKIFTSTNTMSKVDIGKKNQMLYTQLHVREDGLFLFGFSSEEEMEMFKLLLLVTKVGPKVGIGVLSTLTPNMIKRAITTKDIDALCKAPGIGKKTAERIILELKDRIDKNIEIIGDDVEENNLGNHEEALQALMSLGYSRLEIEKVIRQIDTTNRDIEFIIKETLKRLSKH